MKRKTAIVSAAILLLISLIYPSVSAASPDISTPYHTTVGIPNGSLVSVSGNQSTNVEPTNTSNIQRMIGVAIAANQSLLAVNPSSSTVQVATEGTVNTLVSNVNGNISIGQDVTASAFNGIGMKADVGDKTIGTAATTFNSHTSGATSEKVTNTSGNTEHISVGYIKLNIAIGVDNNSGSSIFGALQQFAANLTGHSVSLLRIILSMVIAILVIMAIVTLIYASIYGSIISIGRNPLAKFAVFRTLFSVVGMVLFVACVASVTIYFLLN